MRKEKEMNLERIDIASLIEEVSTTVTDYQPGKVELDSKIKYIISAKLALRQILYNLINNAFVHHFDLSKAKVLIKVREIEGNYIIEVSDNGPGIKPEMHERIFTPFYQLKNTQKAANDGLGLTVVKQLVQTLQGEISVNSEIGKGATFIIKFPKLAS
jgi:signal transduction histidine kinase